MQSVASTDREVPEGQGPGAEFTVAVVRPPDLSGSIFSLPDSFYGLD